MKKEFCSILMGISGIAMVWYRTDWMIVVGLILVMWSNNIQQTDNVKEEVIGWLGRLKK